MTKNETIKMLAEEMKTVANAIAKYTDDIIRLPPEQKSTVALLEDIRLNEMENVQKLTVELTELISESIGQPMKLVVGEQNDD